MPIKIGIGIKSVISISNTKNKTAKRKNRRENGVREWVCGSNPHSNGDCFSRSFIDLKFSEARTIKITKASKKAMENVDKSINIDFRVFHLNLTRILFLLNYKV